MKRKAGALMLLAALGGGCTSMDKSGPAANQYGAVSRARTVPGVQGAWGEPVAQTAQTQSDIILADFKGSKEPKQGHWGVKKGTAEGMAAAPPGAVAALGSLPGIPVGPGRGLGSGRTSVRFVAPAGMKVAWFAPNAAGSPNGFTSTQVEAPGRYNFIQGGAYRLKLTDLPNRPTLELYPTLEVMPATARTATFLAHSAVPVGITEEDLEQVTAGNFVVKVVYLPDPQFQDLAVAGPDEIVSSRLEPGVDPILEAQRRGSVLLVIRMGNIDLEAPNTPALNAPPIGFGGPMGPGGPPPMGPGGPGGMQLQPAPGGVLPGQMPPPGAVPPLPPGAKPIAPVGPRSATQSSTGSPTVKMTEQPAKKSNGSGVVQVGGIIGRMSK